MFVWLILKEINSKKGKKLRNPNTANSNVTSFGLRKISKNNTTNTITLPRVAIENCIDGRTKKFKIELVQQKGEKFIKLSPTKGDKK